MAKNCMFRREERRRKCFNHFAERRNALRTIIGDPKTSLEEKFEAQRKMQDLPRDSNGVRRRNRCVITGRPRGVYRKFGLSRMKLREMMMQGLIPGLRKASW